MNTAFEDRNIIVKIKKRKWSKPDLAKPDYRKAPVNKQLIQQDTSPHDPVCKAAWSNAFFCIHIQDQRLPEELRDELIRYMTNIHGMRAAT
jgi:hypothetical protein